MRIHADPDTDPDPKPCFKAIKILRSHKTVEIKVASLLITDSDLDPKGPKTYESSGSGALLLGLLHRIRCLFVRRMVNIAGEVVYELGNDRRTAVEKLAGHLSQLLQATTVDATAQAGVSPLTLCNNFKNAYGTLEKTWYFY
jgi:hypothetical protein